MRMLIASRRESRDALQHAPADRLEHRVMSNMQYRESLRVGADHPALPGHFPGAPVVPGVVLLDCLAAALQRWRGQRIGGLPQVKFLRPLLPDETAELVLSDDGKSIRFSIALGSAPIASGSIEAAP
jgi:3-hydroxyacyl-[acyl-carrier-protein] dehydratase